MQLTVADSVQKPGLLRSYVRPICVIKQWDVNNFKDERDLLDHKAGCHDQARQETRCTYSCFRCWAWCQVGGTFVEKLLIVSYTCLPVQRYALLLAQDMPWPCACVSITSQYCVHQNGWMDWAHFWHLAYPTLSYRETWVFQNKGTSLCNFTNTSQTLNNTCTTAMFPPLYRSTLVSRHLQLRTWGFCWCKV